MSAAREAIVLPLIFLTVAMFGGLQPGEIRAQPRSAAGSQFHGQVARRAAAERRSVEATERDFVAIRGESPGGLPKFDLVPISVAQIDESASFVRARSERRDDVAQRNLVEGALLGLGAFDRGLAGGDLRSPAGHRPAHV